MADLRGVFTRNFAKSKPAVLAAMAVSGTAYSATLLPGLDLGDTASFQTIVTFPLLVPRHAYPLYFALGKLSVSLAGPDDPARALNALSAFAGAAATGAFAWFAWNLTGSRVASLWAALMLAFSYTFWSHSVIAEVYTLSVLFIALLFGCLFLWWQRPTCQRLAVVYAVYALSFGNHLSMILFAPAIVWVLWCARRRAPLDPFSPGGIALAAVIAALGALQYGWNLHGLVVLSGPRPAATDLFATFWFDVTKSDWRESLVGTVPLAQWGDRLAMYWWDLRQQFGLAGVVVASCGVLVMARASRAWLMALVLAWTATFVFAFVYNVGDTHAFLLPSHVVVAMFAAAGPASVVSATNVLRPPFRMLALIVFALIPFWRAWDTYPAADRSADRRADRLVAHALRGLHPHTSVYVGDLNWQVQNAVNFEILRNRPELARVFSSAVLWHLAEFVDRNHAVGREVVLTNPAAATIKAVYGERFRVVPDPRSPASTLEDLPVPARGTPYILAVLTPLSEGTYDRARISRVARALSGEELPRGRYVVVAGEVGAPPAIREASDRPFDASGRLPFGLLRVRIDAWLPFDTMRRAGFGHAIANGRHALTLERGASLGTFDRAGRLTASAYEGGSFSLDARHVIPVLR